MKRKRNKGDRGSHRIDGWFNLERRLGKLADGGLDIVQGASNSHFKAQRGVLKSTPYAPKLPNQQYVRTGRLANSWSYKLVSAAEWFIYNSAPYSAWVVGKGYQADIHKGRWWTALDILQENMPKLLSDIARKFIKWWSD